MLRKNLSMRLVSDSSMSITWWNLSKDYLIGKIVLLAVPSKSAYLHFAKNKLNLSGSTTSYRLNLNRALVSSCRESGRWLFKGAADNVQARVHEGRSQPSGRGDKDGSIFLFLAWPTIPSFFLRYMLWTATWPTPNLECHSHRALYTQCRWVRPRGL